MRHMVQVNSQVVCEYNIGQIFDVEGKLYILIDRDPWMATLARIYWYDRYIVKFRDWLSKRRGLVTK